MSEIDLENIIERAKKLPATGTVNRKANLNIEAQRDLRFHYRTSREKALEAKAGKINTKHIKLIDHEDPRISLKAIEQADKIFGIGDKTVIQPQSQGSVGVIGFEVVEKIKSLDTETLKRMVVMLNNPADTQKAIEMLKDESKT
jgi:hypothetical protein